MKQIPYPFPLRDEAARTLERDHVYPKIPAHDVPRLVDEAWRVGEMAARDFLARRGGAEELDFTGIMRESGLDITVRDEDFVSGGIRYFADYQPRRRRVTVYRRSVAKWAKVNGLAYDRAVNVILMHEYFHHLECTELGPVSRLRLVPMLRIGGLAIGRTGIPSLSEIAADAFAGVLFKHAAGMEATEPEEPPEERNSAKDSPSGLTTAPSAADGFRNGWAAVAAAFAALILMYNLYVWSLLPGMVGLGVGAGLVVEKSLYLPVVSLASAGLAVLARRREGRAAALATLALLAAIHWVTLVDNIPAAMG